MEVKERIQQQLDILFEDAPKTRAAFELQEELLANCMARYEDLTREGIEPEEALNQVMGSIGNVEELIAALPGEAPAQSPEMEEERRRASALTTAIAIGLYIFAGAVFFIGVFVGSYFFDEAVLIGLIAAILICMVPTCMLVYNAYRWPKYTKKEDTVVEEFKQWNNDSEKTKSVRKAVSSILWTLTVALYLVISFATFAWSVTWIIFPIAACVEAVLTLIFRLREIA